MAEKFDNNKISIDDDDGAVNKLNVEIIAGLKELMTTWVRVLRISFFFFPVTT